MDTGFKIVDVGTVAASSRRLRQVITPLPNGSLRDKLSGRTYSTARPQFRKFETSIYFEDLWLPALPGLFPGDLVTIHSAVEWNEPIRVGEPQIRPAVPGTLRFFDDENRPVPEGHPDALFFNYCPIFRGFVQSWSAEEDEADKASSAELRIRELSADYSGFEV